jgi:hypothetical protein
MEDIIINIITIIIGLVLGIVFGFLLFKQYIYKGPNSNIVSKEIHTEPDGKKFRWIPKICICPVNLSMDQLKNPNYIHPGH